MLSDKGLDLCKLAKRLSTKKAILSCRVEKLINEGYVFERKDKTLYRTRKGVSVIISFFVVNDNIRIPLSEIEIDVLKILEKRRAWRVSMLAKEFNMDMAFMRIHLKVLKARGAVAQDANSGWYKTDIGAKIEENLQSIHPTEVLEKVKEELQHTNRSPICKTEEKLHHIHRCPVCGTDKECNSSGCNPPVLETKDGRSMSYVTCDACIEKISKGTTGQMVYISQFKFVGKGGGR